MRATDRMADIVELREDEHCAVLDLLDRIRHAVGTVHLNLTRGLIDRELVVFEIELAIRQGQTLDHTQLRRLLEVVVAGVIPAAHVHPGNVIATLVLAVRRLVLVPTVELLTNHGCHAAIIQVRSAVPHAVGFAHGDVIHLLGKVMIQAVLPDLRVSVLRDREGCGPLVCVLDDIQAGIFDRGEVEF